MERGDILSHRGGRLRRLKGTEERPKSTADTCQQQRRTCGEIAAQVAVSRATVARIVRRCGWARLHVLELPPTSRRYERAEPGELLHLDTKKLGRIVRPGHRLTGNHHYNWHRPHTSLGGRPPMTRVLTATNLVRLHT